MSESPVRRSATEQLAQLASGERSVTELVDASLASIEAAQLRTNAYSHVFIDDAERAARNADEERRDAAEDGDDVSSLGPLHGIPVAVKDLFDIEGQPTTGCSRFYEGRLAPSDATVIRRLLDAGAVIVGKTNMHELAMGGTNLISACGPTHNPFDLERITGGSSGGSAGALASGTVAIALGTDTGGSIRNPASMCGLFGLKPTQGRVPVDGVLPLAPSLDCPGPMATTAEDLAVLWRVISAKNEPASAVRTVGIVGGFFASLVHPAVRDALVATAAALRAQGIEVVEVTGAGPDDGDADQFLAAWGDLVCMELVESHPGLYEGRDLLFPRTAFFVERGAALTPDERAALRRVPAQARTWFARRLEDVDLLLVPSSPYPAPRATDDEVDVGAGQTVDIHLGGTSRYTRPVSLAGNPAMTIPAGLSSDGLPVGVQFVGHMNAEATMLQLAADLAVADSRFRSPVPLGLRTPPFSPS